jgi:hypothetical protein
MVIFFCFYFLFFDRFLGKSQEMENFFFTQKIGAERLLEKNFVIDIDYKKFALSENKASIEGKKRVVRILHR